MRWAFVDADPVVADFGAETSFAGVEDERGGRLDGHVAIDTVGGELGAEFADGAALRGLMAVEASRGILGGGGL